MSLDHFLASTTGACSAARIFSKKLRTELYCSTGTVPAFWTSLRVNTNCPSLTS